MTRKLQMAVIGSLLGGWAVLTSGGANAQGTPAPSITVSFEKKVITQHEPVVVMFTIGNSSSEAEAQDAVFDPGYDYQNVHVTVTDPDGRVWPKPLPPKWTEGTKFSEAVHIRPGTTAVSSIVLNVWFHFDKVGTYRINLSVAALSNSPAAEMQVPETSLTLNVLPANGDSLASACAVLAARLENSKSFVAARTAAEALSSVDDPAVVPFLAEAMKRKDFAATMVDALARLNTSDAVNALFSASRWSDPETSALARAALVRLGKIESLR